MAGVNPAPAGWSGGDGDCEDCASWSRHFYWNHAGGYRKQFVIVASEGFRDHVTIPPAVGSHLRTMIADREHVKLETPDGRTYDVKIMMFYDMFLFTSGETSGWQEFVDANEIQEGHSIMFVYCGNSTFKHFCVEYASECLPAEQKGLLLLLEGDEREWTGKLDISRNDLKKQIGWVVCGVWRDFVWQVGLKEGDICLFELVDKSARWITMKVYLIRRSEIQP